MNADNENQNDASHQIIIYTVQLGHLIVAVKHLLADLPPLETLGEPRKASKLDTPFKRSLLHEGQSFMDVSSFSTF